MIRKIIEKDIPAVVALYDNYMFDSSFRDFGRGFLGVVLKGILNSKLALGYVWEEGAVVQGFIISTTDSQGLFLEILLKKALSLLGQASLALIQKPFLFLKIAESFFYFWRTKLEDIKAEFLFITIDPAFRNRGISKELIIKTLAEFASRGVLRAKVTTKKDNQIVNNLLKNLGFNLLSSFGFHGKENLLYEVRISGDTK